MFISCVKQARSVRLAKMTHPHYPVLTLRTTCRMINMARSLTRPSHCAKIRRSTGVATAGNHLLRLQGVAEMLPTARVQQGLS